MMLTIIIVSSLLLLVSLFVIISLIWYAKNIVRQLWDMTSDLKVLDKMLLEYEEKLDNLLTTELFYDNAVIKDLLSHTKYVRENIQVMKEPFAIAISQDIKEMK